MPPKKAPAKKADTSAAGSVSIVCMYSILVTNVLLTICLIVFQARDAGSVKEFIGPSNTCDFKISMEVNHEAGHYLKVKYDWINVAQGAEAKEITFPEIDTGYFRDWNLVQIEGEEPVSQEELDPKAKAAAAKKPPPAKGGNTSKLEEITDNRPRIISYERDCAAESNGVGLDVTEEIAIKF